MFMMRLVGAADAHDAHSLGLNWPEVHLAGFVDEFLVRKLVRESR